MRCLTVRQPWGWGFEHGKDVENRTRPTRYTGEVAIHCSAAMGARYVAKYLRWMSETVGIQVPTSDVLRYALRARLRESCGRVIGVARITGCVPAGEIESRWGMFGEPGGPPMWWWRIEGFESLRRKIPAVGRLGLWYPDDGLVEKIVAERARTRALMSANDVNRDREAVDFALRYAVDRLDGVTEHEDMVRRMKAMLSTGVGIPVAVREARG